jgi:hypothetical protein
MMVPGPSSIKSLAAMKQEGIDLKAEAAIA